jgi:hypothetical protein
MVATFVFAYFSILFIKIFFVGLPRLAAFIFYFFQD